MAAPLRSAAVSPLHAPRRHVDVDGTTRAELVAQLAAVAGVEGSDDLAIFLAGHAWDVPRAIQSLLGPEDGPASSPAPSATAIVSHDGSTLVGAPVATPSSALVTPGAHADACTSGANSFGCSFDFPNWKYRGGESEAGTGVSAAPKDQTHDWMGDLDDLSADDDDDPGLAHAGDDDARAPKAARGVEQTAWAGSAERLEQDVLAAVVSHLCDVRSVLSARAVSVAWRAAASANNLWAPLWAARFGATPHRSSCGAAALGAPPPLGEEHFFAFAMHVRAQKCTRWFELQKGWDRLELILDAALADGGGRGVGGGSSEGAAGGNGAAHTGELMTARRLQARKLGVILAARDWERLYSCVLLLQLECAEAFARTIDVPSPAGAGDAQSARDDEAILAATLRAFGAYSSWLDLVAGCFAHQPGSPCSSHLCCRIAEQRGKERVEQHTPSLKHAGFCAFRSAVVLRPRVRAALRRHTKRAAAAVLEGGGYTSESGLAMQQMLDLQRMVCALDVRDDHLCEERGLQFTQERLRESLLEPLRRCWHAHATTWFCGTKIPSEDLKLYRSSGRRDGLINPEGERG